jgi:hypothetical protein
MQSETTGVLRVRSWVRNSYDENNKSTGSLTSPTALSHLSRRLEIPRPDSPGVGGSDFATGYSLGLIGGVRSWVSCLDLLLKMNINRSIDDQKSPVQLEQPERQ